MYVLLNMAKQHPATMSGQEYCKVSCDSKMVVKSTVDEGTCEVNIVVVPWYGS